MYDGTKTTITVDHSDDTHVYFSEPDNIRVVKATGEIQLFKYGKRWETIKPFLNAKPGNEKKITPQLRISRVKKNSTKTWLASKIIATACVPNPNNYDFIRHIDGNVLNNAPSNLEWVDDVTGYWCNRTNGVLTIEQRKQLTTPGSHSHNNKDFMHQYNAMRDSNGLTHTQRFKAKFRDAGYVYQLNPATKKYEWRGRDGIYYTTKQLKQLVK